jgi:hypothetical protein
MTNYSIMLRGRAQKLLDGTTARMQEKGGGSEGMNAERGR